MKNFVIYLIINAGVLHGAYSSELLDRLIERRDAIKHWAPVCKEGPYRGQYTESFTSCHQGDMTIFAGLGCLAATLAKDKETLKARCRDVKRAQGPDGRWWRGETRVDDEAKSENSFSRDQMRGLLSYFISKGTVLNPNEVEREKVIDSALKWADWVSDIGNGRMCLKSTDNRCTIKGSDLYYVFNTMGILPAKGTRKLKRNKLFKKAYSGRKSSLYLTIETQLAPKGYPLHLKAATVLIRRTINSINELPKVQRRRVDKVASILYKKEKDNHYFEFLHKKKVSKQLVRKVMKRCPTNLRKGQTLLDWQWQRATKDKPWEKSNGHDCIFLLNLMIAKLQGTLGW